MGVELFDGRTGGVLGPSPADPRNFLFGANLRAFGVPFQIPDGFSMWDRMWMPPIGDQGNVGQCVGWSTSTLRESISLRVGHAYQDLSALWLYQEILREFWDPRVDSGCYLSQAMKIVRGRGIAVEAEYASDPSKFGQSLPSATYAKAIWYRNVNYYAVQGVQQMLQCLASANAFVFGFIVRANFREAAGHGRVPMPAGLILGAHAVCAGGYKLDAAWPGGGFIEAQNSWGNWTDDGRLRFPLAMMDDPAHVWDCWTLRLRAEAAPEYLDAPGPTP